MKNIPKSLLKFYEEFKTTNYLTEIDFIQERITGHKLSTEDELVDHFLRFSQCEPFLRKIARHFIQTRKLKRVNENRVKVLVFCFIFVLNCDNVDDILDDPVFYTVPLLNFLSDEENFPFIARCCTEHFDNDFTVKNVMEPLMNRANAFKCIEKYIHAEKLKKLPHNHVTVPKEFKFEHKNFGSPHPPVNTPTEVSKVLQKPDSRSYMQLQKALQAKHAANVAKAEKLLSDAQNCRLARLSTVKPIKEVEEPAPIEKKIRKTNFKPPSVKPVEIKGNTTTTLRAAYLLLKEHEEEITKIENIIQGGYNMQKVVEIEEEERRKVNQKAMESIQKKHLLGLITFEESILAKKKLIENNKKRMAEIVAEKIELAERLEEWRKMEQEKIKAKVEKSQQIKVDMKESEKKKLEKKQEEVRIQQLELREMLKRNEEEKQAELAKKIDLIQEIKTIHEMNRKMNESRYKVNGGSPAERAGLIAGDAVIKINNTDVYNLRHKDAQDVVLRAGPSFEMSIQRGGSTWKPSVVPTGPLSTPSPFINTASPVTKTSLASSKSDNIGAIGTGHNISAKPFVPQVNGAVNGGPRLVNTQYNSPVKLYSEESIAETLSAQTEVLSTGALGVNFKKNEKNYDASNSEVLRALKEAENDSNYNDQEPDSGVVTSPNSGIAGLRHVQAPENKPQPPQQQLPPGQNICADCERLIVGVFVRIKDKNLHVECFKCSTCGSSLKNVGYYNINNKLYCDIHAKSAALKNQSNPNLVPVTIPPGGKVPAHAISSALSSHPYPTSPLSPKLNTAGGQFQAEDLKENVDVSSSSELPVLPKPNVSDSNIRNNNKLSNSTPLSFNKYLNYKSNITGPKPFSSVAAPLSPSNTLPRAAPHSPVAPAPAPSFNSHSYTPSAYSPSSVHISENIIWPPPQEHTEVPTACPLFYPPPSQIEERITKKRREKEIEASAEEYCSEVEEINAMAQQTRFTSELECRETLTGTLDTQLLVENIVKRNTPPTEVVYIKPCPKELPEDLCCQQKDTKESIGRVTPGIENAVPLKWESPLTQAIRTTSPDKDTFASIPTKHSSSALASALSVAPLEPFTPSGKHEEPVPLPEETVPYFPPERPVLPPEQYGYIEDSSSTVPPIRKKFKNPNDKLLEDLPKPQQKLSMLTALTTAPDRPYSPFVETRTNLQETGEKSTPEEFHTDLNRPLKPDVLPASFEMQKTDPKPPSYYPPSVLYEKTEAEKSEEHTEESNTTKTTTIQRETVQNPELIQIVLDDNNNTSQNVAPLFHGFSCSFQNKGDISQFSVDVRTTPPINSTPPPSKPIVKTIESRPGFVQTVTEEKTEKQQTIKKSEQMKKEQKITQNVVARQAEEAVPIKATQPVALKRPKQLPQYQVELSAEAESELILFERKRQAELRLEEQKNAKTVTQDSTKVLPPPPPIPKPIIKVEAEDNNKIFKPVDEDLPPSKHSTTPSRTGTKSPLLPYYQVNLVPQHMSALHSNIFDPRSPAVSRSPSPLPGGVERATSPVSGKSGNVRPVSPAAGPPENPLTSTKPLPNPESIRVDQARDNLTQYLPEYKSKRDLIEGVGQKPQMYTSSVQTQSLPAQSFSLKKTDLLEAEKCEKSFSQLGDTVTSTSVDEQLRQARLEKLKQSQSESVERSADGRTQIQRKKIVTEEYERLQKEVNIQIEKHSSSSSSKKYPFASVNVPPVEPVSSQGHITDPQRKCVTRPAASAQSTVTPASAATKHVFAPTSTTPPKQPNVPSVSQPDTGAGSGKQAAGVRVAPRRGKGTLNAAAIGSGRIPLCGSCNSQVRQSENLLELDEISLQIPNQPPPPPPVPVYSQINVTIPYQSASPQLDSIGSSPRSDYSSYSSSSGKNTQTAESAREKIVSEIKAITPKLKNVNISDTQSPRLNYVVSNVETTITNNNKKVTSELFIPINNYHSSKDNFHIKSTDLDLPDHLTYSNPSAEGNGISKVYLSSGVTKDVADYRDTNNIAGVPICWICNLEIARGPFITALGKIWCPNHFVCATQSCRRPLQDIGFVEERGQLYCEYCFEQYLAPPCSKCAGKIKGDCLKAIGKNFHPECFNCTYCGKLFGNSPFFLEDGSPYCEADWNELFTTKCFACAFPIEAGDRWVEALSNNYHSQCFNCTMCKKNLEGQSFFAKGGRPFCKTHAR